MPRGLPIFLLDFWGSFVLLFTENKIIPPPHEARVGMSRFFIKRFGGREGGREVKGGGGGGRVLHGVFPDGYTS